RSGDSQLRPGVVGWVGGGGVRGGGGRGAPPRAGGPPRGGDMKDGGRAKGGGPPMGGMMSLGRGPDLSNVSGDPAHTRDWIKQHILDPQSHKEGSRMPKFAGKLADNDLEALLDYLV